MKRTAILLALILTAGAVWATRFDLGSLPFAVISVDGNRATLGPSVSAGPSDPFIAYTNLVGWWIGNISEADATAGVYPDPINSLDGTQSIGSARGTYTNDHGGGITLDGGDWVVIPDHDLLTFTNGAGEDAPFSILLHLKTGAVSANSEWPLSKRNDDESSPNSEYSFFLKENSGEFQGGTQDATAGNKEQRKGATAINAASSVVGIFTYDGGGGSTASGGMLVYSNGIDESGITIDAGTYVDMHNTAVDLYIGAVGVGGLDNGFNFVGDIYDVMLFNKKLTLTEVTNVTEYVRNN